MNIHWSPCRKILSILALSLSLALLPILVSSAFAQGDPGSEGPALRRHLARVTANLHLINMLPEGQEIEEIYFDRAELDLEEALERGDGERVLWFAPVPMIGRRLPPRAVAKLLVVGPGVRAQAMLRLKVGQDYCVFVFEDDRGRQQLDAKWQGPEKHERTLEKQCERLAPDYDNG